MPGHGTRVALFVTVVVLADVAMPCASRPQDGAGGERTVIASVDRPATLAGDRPLVLSLPLSPDDRAALRASDAGALRLEIECTPTQTAHGMGVRVFVAREDVTLDTPADSPGYLATFTFFPAPTRGTPRRRRFAFDLGRARPALEAATGEVRLTFVPTVLHGGRGRPQPIATIDGVRIVRTGAARSARVHRPMDSSRHCRADPRTRA